MTWRTIKGLAYASTGGTTPALPGGWAENDILLILCESNASDAVTAPSGYAHVTGSPVVGADTQLSVFWKRATSSESDPTIADPGDHIYAQMVAIRGATTTGDPLSVGTSGTASANATIVFPSLASVAFNDFVIAVASTGRDSSTTVTSPFTTVDPDQLAFLEDHGQTSSQGGGGGILWAAGLSEAPGTVDGIIAAQDATQANAMLVLAFTSDGVSDARAEVSKSWMGLVIDTVPPTDAGIAKAWMGVVVDTDPAGPSGPRRRQMWIS